MKHRAINRYSYGEKSNLPLIIFSRMKLIIFYVFTFCICYDSLAQSYITKNENYIEPILINPAIAGADFIPKVTLSYNKQWMNINQSPSNFFLSGQMRLGKFDYYDPQMLINETKFKSLERVGLGAGLYMDNNGPFQEYNMLLTYSYHLPINDYSNLSFGLTGKINHYGVNNSEINPRHIDDPLVTFESSTNTNINSGLYYYHRKYFAGISMINLLKPTPGQYVNVESDQIFYLIGGYRFRNKEKSIFIEPMFTYSHNIENGLNHLDCHARFHFINYGWVSISYKNTKQIGVILTLNVHKSLYVAYMFTSVPKEMQPYGNNTHGIVIGANLGVSNHTKSNY